MSRLGKRASRPPRPPAALAPSHGEEAIKGGIKGEQEVADVQCHGQAVMLVEGLPAVALPVGVLDVIVNERGLVKGLDREAKVADLLRQAVGGSPAQL